MTNSLVIQGRQLGAGDLELIRSLQVEHREWGRTRLSEELCRRWDWRNGRGQMKDMAARTLLTKLEQRGHIQLPKPLHQSSGRWRKRGVPPAEVEYPQAPIAGVLAEVRPITVTIVAAGSPDQRLFNVLLQRHHYLGHRRTVGENLGYLFRDSRSRVVGCALFGSAAWKCAARDDWIGWNRRSREAKLGLLTSNTRFLILPWVRVPHLASHLLGCVARRLSADWQAKYGHPIVAVETFVERERFRGTCYRAANWVRVGATQGRTRNDRERRIRSSVKDVYLLALNQNFRRELGT
jgi:Domain of unknown function (DUF4338)